VAHGTVEELTRRAAKYKVTATAIDDALLAQFHAERVNGHIELSVEDLQQLNALVDQIRARGGLVSELSPLRSTLEDVFVDLVRAQP
jgi:hypothetical protein